MAMPAAHAFADGICTICGETDEFPQGCIVPPQDEPGVPQGGPADDGLADV